MRAAALIIFAVLCSGRPAAQTDTSPDHAQEAVLIEQTRTLYRFEKDGTGRRESHTRLKIQSEAGVQQFGQLLFGYNSANERLDIAFVRVKKPDGSVVTTAPDGVQDLSSPVQRIAPVYTDFRQKHVTVQGLRPGDTLEFSVVTIVHTALAPGQFWAEYEFQRQLIVLDEQLQIDVPADQPITLKTRTGFDPSIREENGRRTYTWTHANLKRQDDTGESTPKGKQEPQVAAIRLTTFQSWEQIGRWYAALEAPQRVPNAEIRKKAAELTARGTSELEKIEALYEFVATNFRYVSLSLGMGRYQPRAATDVLREQYGDCKDKHTLLASLMDAAGLKASAVLISSSAKLDPTFPSPSQFDHVITRAIASGEEVWVDTTSEVAPFRLLLPTLRKKQALVVDSEGTPRLHETPANPPMKSVVKQDVEGSIAESGKLEAHVRMTLRGDVELLMRTLFRAAPAAQWKEFLEAMVAAQELPGEVANWKVADPAALKTPFTIEFDVSLARYVDWTSNKVAVVLPLSAAATIDSPDESTDQDSTVELGAAPAEVSYKLRLQLPAGATARPPLPVTVARDYAEYRATYAMTGSVLTAERVATIRQSELPAARREDYAAFIRVISADARQSFTVQAAANASPSAVEDLKASELNRRGYEALQAGNYSQAIAWLKRVVELEPKEKTAWVNLGRAYMGLRQHDAAIEAFKKQIEINAYDAYAYTNLGRAYVAQRKYGEAEAAFKKQLDVNPLDQYAPANLAALYVERRQYEAAIPYLDKAIALAPDDSWLQVQLGKAHLNLKHDAEAMAAFDRAVELSPTPTIWNNVAYELALAGVHLKRAQQYAESAVASATAASRNLDLARADDKAMDVVRSLAAYWDTLGWVYFAQGNAARAERFVEASWRLGQHADVGDHLAQIYERLGRRDDAIRTYALALLAPNPSDDTRERLAKLTGGQPPLGALLDAHREQLAGARTVSLHGKGTPGKSAEVLVLFSSPSSIDGVRFIGSDDTLRNLEPAIRETSYARMFPDDAPARLLRRGTVACATDGRCTLTFTRADDAEPVK